MYFTVPFFYFWCILAQNGSKIRTQCVQTVVRQLFFFFQVLVAKSGRCFTEPEESFCGNLRVEGDEECDAGLLGSEDSDECCDEYCKLKEHAKCSDKNSPCCSRCNYSKVGEVCRHANYATCEQVSFKLEFEYGFESLQQFDRTKIDILIFLAERC